MPRSSPMRLLAIAGLSIWAGVANAQLFFASHDDTLVRTDLTTFDSFTLSDTIHSLEFDDQGVLWATSRDSFGGFWRLYHVDDPFGTPTLSLVTGGLTDVVPSIAWVGDTLYGVRIGPANTNQLVTIDVGTGALTSVGVTGETGGSGGGIEYDPTTGNMYMTKHDVAGLTQLDWTLSFGSEPTATSIGDFGTPRRVRSSGLACRDATGQLYALLTERVTLTPKLYEIDKVTGAATVLTDLTATLGAGDGGNGLAVAEIPTTGCANPQPGCDLADIAPVGALDCVVNLNDLGLILTNFEIGVGGKTRDDGDISPVGGGDGFVDLGDLGLVLSVFGTDCR